MTRGLVVSPCLRPGSAQSVRPTRLLFGSSRDSADRKTFDIFTMKPDGTSPVNLTKSEANEFDPAWAPEGQRIAFVVFTRGASPTESKSDLFVMNADGSARKQLTQVEAGTMALSPSWSADGQRLAYCVLTGFGSNRPPTGFIETMKLDGSDVTRLRDGLLPAWSPDGKRLFTTRMQQPPTMGASIWSYEADGSGSTLIGDGSTVDFIGAGGVFLVRLQ